MKYTKLVVISAVTLCTLGTANIAQASSLFGDPSGLFGNTSNTGSNNNSGLFGNTSNTEESDSITAATNAVEGLFTDSTHTAIRATTTSASIQAARRLILKCSGLGSYVTTLGNLCTKAEALLNQSTHPTTDPATKAATDAVEGLFTDSTHTAIRATTTSASIQAARRLILKCSGLGSYVTTLGNLCTKAETLLNQSTTDPATKAATDAVEGLFTDSTHTAIRATTTSTSIQAARRLIFKMPVMSKNIRSLNDLCTKAQTLLYTV